ncbi:TPA: hypothetical protein ACH3X1_013226 [Trebouxia sp. C0004]
MTSRDPTKNPWQGTLSQQHLSKHYKTVAQAEDGIRQSDRSKREANQQLRSLITRYQVKDKDFKAFAANTEQEDLRLRKEIIKFADKAKTLRKHRDVLQAEAVQRRSGAAQGLKQSSNVAISALIPAVLSAILLL